jgi:hypothetical protein
VITKREGERHERRLPHAWLRRSLMTAGVVVTGWLFLGGSPAEAAAAAPVDPADATLAAVSATEAEPPGGVEIVERTAARAAEVRERDQQRSHRHDQATTGQRNRSRVDGVVDGTVRSAGTPVEQSGPATEVARPDATASLDAVAATAQPVLEPVHEVTPATPGEPGVLSLRDREAPGSGVEAPRAITGPITGPISGLISGPGIQRTTPATSVGTQSRAATADSAPPSSGWLPSTHSSGSRVGGSGAGSDEGPGLPHPATPVPGPSHDVPDGTASTASGHGSVDRGQNVSTEVSPFVVAPRLVTSLPAMSRSTGHPERASRPSVSPD